MKAGLFGIGGVTIKAAKYSGSSETAFAPVVAQNQLVLPGQPVLFANASGPCFVVTPGPGSGTTFIRYQDQDELRSGRRREHRRATLWHRADGPEVLERRRHE